MCVCVYICAHVCVYIHGYIHVCPFLQNSHRQINSPDLREWATPNSSSYGRVEWIHLLHWQAQDLTPEPGVVKGLCVDADAYPWEPYCLVSRSWLLIRVWPKGWKGLLAFRGIQALSLLPLTLAPLSLQKLEVVWGPLHCSLLDPCQALPPASSTSHSTFARLWMANARRSLR